MTIFVVGTFWFWLILIIAGILGTWFLEKEESYGSGTAWTLGLTGAVLYLFGSKKEVTDLALCIAHNPGMIAGLFISYIIIGTVWSIVKWYLFVKMKYRFVTKKRPDYAQKLDLEKMSQYRPLAVDEKYRIMSWMLYWPLSVIWTAINNPFRKAFNAVYNSIEGIFDSISNSIFKNAVKAEVFDNISETADKRRKTDV